MGYTSPNFPAMAMPGWSHDWTSDDAWFRTIFDRRVYNMFVNALRERVQAMTPATLVTSPIPYANVGDYSIEKWGTLAATVQGMATGGVWANLGLLPTYFDNTPTSLGAAIAGTGWFPADLIFNYPREINTLTPTGSEVAGWRARYVGHGSPGIPGHIYEYTAGTTNAWVDLGTAFTGLPDLGHFTTVAGVQSLPAGFGYTTSGSRTPYFGPEFLNGMRDTINLLVTTLDSSDGIPHTGGWTLAWSNSDSEKSGVSGNQHFWVDPPTLADAKMDYDGGWNDFSSFNAPAANGTIDFNTAAVFAESAPPHRLIHPGVYNLSKTVNKVGINLLTGLFTRNVLVYSLVTASSGGFDANDFPVSTPGKYNPVQSFINYSGGLLYGPTLGDASIYPTVPGDPPPGGVASIGCGLGRPLYMFSSYDIAGGFKYVAGYSGT